MATKPGTLQEGELKQFLDVSRFLVGRATFSGARGLGLRATPPDGKYPYVDTRAVAAAIVALGELGDYVTARALCSFLLEVQSSAGCWVPCYDDRGDEAAANGDEDVTALALWALMSYVRVSGDEAFADEAREHVEEAARYTRARTLNPYLYLVETSGSLHGTAVSSGYELWNNCAHAAAFALCHRVYGGERFRRLALLIRRAIGLLMTFEGRFLRRLDPHGYPDPRPDICLLAPYYFGLWSPTERMVMNSAELIERSLWNVEVGGYCRFLPFSAVERSGLFGPSPRFTAWMAQYHYDLGNKDRAEAIIRWQFDNALDGQLADVLVPSTSASRYLPEQRRGLSNGAGPERVAELYRERLLADLEAVDTAAEQCEVVPSGVPLVWAHFETLRALRKGGYIERWQLSPRAADSPQASGA